MSAQRHSLATSNARKADSLTHTYSIVAIHGLGGHPFKTWAAGDRMWLKDFLPKEIPEARILTYGYNSGVAFNKSASDISDFSRDLLERLLAIRRRALASVGPLLASFIQSSLFTEARHIRLS